MAQILLLDDESELREEIADYLRGLHHDVQEVARIRQFRQFFPLKVYDIVIIDRMLPDGDGLDLVSELLAQGARCGIVLFTARDASTERILGYKNGADHYLTKPIRLAELAAVIDALARRILVPVTWRLNNSDWALITPEKEVIKLTAQEHGFLHALATVNKKTLSRRKIVDLLGKDMTSYDPRNLDALVLRLCKKVAEISPTALPLKTVHGAGYALSQDILVE